MVDHSMLSPAKEAEVAALESPLPAEKQKNGEKEGEEGNSLLFSICSHEIIEESYTVYGITVVSGSDTFTVRKRYSQLLALHEELCERFGSHMLPEFPPKKFFGVLEEEFILERRSALNNYLRRLSGTSMSDSATMTNFLHCDAQGADSDHLRDCDHSGYVYKQGRYLKQWNSRWFVLKDDEIIYFKSRMDVQRRGVIPLKGCSFVIDRRSNREWTFGIYNPQKATVYISLDTEQDMMRWIKALDKEESKVGLADFELLAVIGKGSFGKVMQVRKRDNGQIYAMKVLRKEAIRKRNQVEHTRTERQLLQRIHHPFLVDLKYAFQTGEKLYMVLDYVNGGEIFGHLKRERRFPEARVRLYAAEVVLALGYLHSMDVVYRDLKPENILLDSEGHIRLTDFGLSKMISGQKSTYTFCGTPEYMAPEILMDEGHGKAVDWWSLGILIFEMLVGLPPFYSRNKKEMYFKILKCDLRFPTYVSEDARTLLLGLLTRDVSQRLGSGPTDAEAIKAHPFFFTCDWDRILAKDVKPTFRPNVKSDSDFSNFDQTFTSQRAELTPNDSAVLREVCKDFVGFTYTPTSVLNEVGEVAGFE